MAKFIECTADDGVKVWVNFDKVLQMRRVERADPKHTQLHFEGQSLNVQEEPGFLATSANAT